MKRDGNRESWGKREAGTHIWRRRRYVSCKALLLGEFLGSLVPSLTVENRGGMPFWSKLVGVGGGPFGQSWWGWGAAEAHYKLQFMSPQNLPARTRFVPLCTASAAEKKTDDSNSNCPLLARF
ncbi:hypothetical protein V6N13_094266 [Hibiscus sabdariffa]|uniref:Uncharacterized protein n=1 Tax=Hibiscus sabdariffa TaxID=183260 RepID=A0ABR2PQ92_9ROSI